MTEEHVSLHVRHLSKSFLGQRALDDVSLQVAAGEIHGLVGHNGSGKSTLIKILAGYHRADRGDVALTPSGGDPRAHLRFVHQDLGLVDTMDTVDNLALGSGYETGLLRRIRWRSEVSRARRRMGRLNARHDVRLPVGWLAPVERTMIALARALDDRHRGSTPSLGTLVLDEPTATLSGAEVELLLGILKRLADEGLGVLFVSHRLDEVLAIAHRISVLRDGRLVGTFGTENLDRTGLAELVAGRAIKGADRHPIRPVRSASNVSRLQVCGLVGDRLAGIDIDVAAGEVVGVAGVLGSGREELAGLIVGLRRADRGRVIVDGRPLEPPSPRSAVAAGVALVPADRAGFAAVSTMTVGENMSLPWLGTLRRRGRVDHRAERSEVHAWCRRVDVRPARPDVPFPQLSGGNQQKVVLARWLRTRPKVLVLDGPTNGVDVGAKEAIHRLVTAAAGDGAAVLVCSSDDDELATLCQRVIVLLDGHVFADLEGEELTPERIVAACLGGERTGEPG